MEERGPSLAEIQEVPKNNLILLAGPPGAGKSTRVKPFDQVTEAGVVVPLKR